MQNVKTSSGASSRGPNRLRGVRHFLLLWPLFFAICFGLGYPILHRYDPRNIPGLSDVYKYYAITTGADTSAFRELFRSRVLVPFVAQPFYWFARAKLPNWNAGFFGLLVANSIFCATTACLIMSIGIRLIGQPGTALLGSTLYLLSFTVPNLQLAGLVDAGEACFMIAIVWSLLTDRFYLLPLWGLLGAMAKETFVPFSVVLAFTWWLTAGAKRKQSEFMWIAALAIVGLTTVMLIRTAIAGEVRWPWNIAAEARVPGNFLVAVWHCLTEKSFWYVFGWLIPLGIWRLRYFPRPWLISSIAACVIAVLLGGYINAGGTIGRSTFDIIGPLLSLSVALLLVETLESAQTSKQAVMQDD